MKNLKNKALFGKLTGIVAALTLAAGALTGCSAGNVSAENSGELNTARTIRFADQANYIPAKIALEKGFFAEEFGDDYNFEVHVFENGPAINEAITAGELDFAAYGDTPAIQGFANGIDVQIISTLWLSDNAYALIAGPDSGVESTKDLKGKRLGYRAGTTTHQLILKILEKEGLKESDVTLVNIGSAEGIAAIVAGDLDTVIAAQPFEPTLEQTGGKLIVTNKDYNVQPVFILAKGDFAKKNPEIVSRVLKVLDKATKWGLENPDEAVKIVSDFNGSDIEGVRTYFETRDWVIGWQENLEGGLEDSIQFAYDNGNITSKFDVKDLVNTSFLENAGLYNK